MATRLLDTKSQRVLREVLAPRTGRVVVKLEPVGISVREVGRRTWYGPMTYGSLFVLLARLTADMKRAERRKARKAGKARRAR
jgi:hypothetical protein